MDKLDKLYKYMKWAPLDKDGNQTKCYTRDNLINNQLHFSSVRDFNDPFDICPYINPECTEKELLKRAIIVVARQENISIKKAKEKAKMLISSQNLNSIENRIERGKLLAEDFNNIGVCCFTTNSPETTLMWSHYADSHKGICLIFIPSGSIRLFGKGTKYVVGPIKVNYANELPSFHLVNPSVDEMSNCICTKSKDWEYEHEYRAIAPNFIGEKQWDFHLLSAIVAGCKMPDAEFEELKKTILSMKYVKPALYLAQKKKREFGFNLKRIDI